VPGSNKKTFDSVDAQHVEGNFACGCSIFSALAMPISIKTLFLGMGVAVRPRAPFKKVSMYSRFKHGAWH